MNVIAPICQSTYVSMHDGTRLAVSTWLPNECRSKGGKYTAILTTTRYWRATALHQDNPEFQLYYPFARYLLAQGYVLSRWMLEDQAPPLVAGKLNFPSQRWKTLVRLLIGFPSNRGVMGVSLPRAPLILRTRVFVVW